MSNAGQAALTIVGTAIGFFVGAPQLGFVLGSLAGSALFPTQGPNISGPQLNDHNTTSAELGAPVADIVGTMCTGGTVIWLGELIETSTTEEVGGKGGPPEQTVTSFSYTQSIAIGLCRAPPGREMGGLLRIWENGKLVYDIRPQQSYESDEDFSTRLTASTTYADTFVLYLGSETQLADPTIEAAEGIGNVPAFRELMYIVYPNRALQDNQAQRHPQFKFEVYESGTADVVDTFAQSVVYPWLQGATDPRNPLNTHEYMTNTNGVWTDDFTAALTSREASATLNYIYTAAGAVGYQRYTETVTPALIAEFGPYETATINFNVGAVGIFYPTGQAPTGFLTGSNTQICSLAYGADQAINGTPVEWYNPGAVSAPDAAFWTHWDPGGSNPWQHGQYAHVGMFVTNNSPSIANPGCTTDPSYVVISGNRYGPAVVSFAGDIAIYTRRVPQPPAATGWTLAVGTFKVLQSYSEYGGNGVPFSQPVGPALRDDDALYNDQATWEAHYAQAVADGTMPSGLTYSADYPVVQNFAWQATSGTSITPNEVSIADCLERIALRAGLALTDIDVEDLRENYITGWSIQRVMTARDAIQSLIPVGFFDVVESGVLIKFPTRGRGIVATLQTDDLGAASSGGQARAAIESTMQQDVELPKQIRLHYIATSRDYEAGEQLSVTRISTDADQIVDVQAAIAMSDTKAVQAADILWSDAWAGRWTHEIAIDRSYSQLEGADCIAVPIGGRWVRCRISQITDQAALLRKLKLTEDDDGAYVSTRIAAAPDRAPNILQVYQDTELVLLDIPALRDTDNNAGIYGAVRATGSGNAWLGALIWRSLDGTGGWSNIASATAQATMGTLSGPPGVGITTTWDTANTIQVTLQSGTLSSKTEDQILSGENLAAIGVDGRWELVQFRTATQLTSTTWELSNLLRGRRGTEHLVGTAQAAERFVLLSGSGVFHLPLDTTEIGQVRTYRAVSAGKSFASGTDQTFTGRGVALLPFSPVLLEAETVDGDIVFTWVRRGRIGRTLVSGADIPLSEETESYSIDIYAEGSPTQVVRTLTSTTQTVTYTSAQQTTDFGSPGPTSVQATVYQLSAVVGRGTPAEITT